MSKLIILRERDPEEAIRLLSVVSDSLLPNPGIDDVTHHTQMDPDLINAILTEIRRHLRLPEGDESVATQSKIYAFLSEEISSAALGNADLDKLKTRLGDKGELHPSQYQVRFAGDLVDKELLGDRKSFIIEAVTRPDMVAHLRTKTLELGNNPRITISIKFVNTRKAEDKFALFAISSRAGQVLRVGCVFRAYYSDVDLRNINEPVDVVKAFIDAYGLRFSIGNIKSKFIYKDFVEMESEPTAKDMRVLEGQKGHAYWKVLLGGETRLSSPSAVLLGEMVLAFCIDISKYVATLRKHHVHIDDDVERYFPRI